MINAILFIVIFIFLLFLIYIISRLFAHILFLEEELKKYIYQSENIKRSLSEIIHDDYLKEDGRLKKFRILKPKKPIINDLGGEEFIEV